jgi:hypothetical protein
VTFLFQNFSDFLSGAQNQLAEEFATDVLNFANGKEPWQNWTKVRKVAKVIATDGSGMKEDVPDKIGRRKFFVDLANEVGFDTLRGAFDRFMTS